MKAVCGLDYSEALTQQSQDLGAETKFGQVQAVRREEDRFVLTAGKKEYEGKALILATGAKHRHLGVEGEEAMTGRGVSYCAVCDGAFFKDKETAVVGGGDSALQSAIFLSGICKKVTLIHRRDQFRGQDADVQVVKSRENIELALNSQVTALHGEPLLTGVTLTNKDGTTRELSIAGLFVAVGQEPDNQVFTDLVDLDEAGYIVAGEDCLTRTPGVFTAGDCRTKTLRQLTTAAADGSVAATAACRFVDGQA